jgi:alpha-D-xyloside xylohydrolase
LYKRWIAFGLLSSHSRLHGSSSYRVPWLFDEEAVDVLRFFTRLKCRLMPYLYAQAIATARTGVPLMRAMLLEFPGDPACAYLDRQYMLGDSLLVAPVFSHDDTVEYYVPAGRWTHFLSGAVVEGPIWVREMHDAMSLPLLVRPGSVITLGHRDDRPDYDYGDGATLEVYELAEGHAAAVAIPSLTGDVATTFEVRRVGGTIVIERRGAAHHWQLELVGIDSIASVEGGSAEPGPRGVRLTPAPGVERLEIGLA